MEYFFVYILKCSDGSYYTGHTDNLEKRISEHQIGKYAGYTSSRLPVQVVFAQFFASRIGAIAAELRIKKWSRKKKEALIQKNWKRLQYLARNYSQFGIPN